MSTANPTEQAATQLPLSMSLVPGALTRPLLAGDVVPHGTEVTITTGKSVDGNSRQMLNLAFDVAEMSLATFLKAREQGTPLIGLPIFTGRRFLQPCVLVSAGADVASPADLAGKRVGLPQFWMTSSLWHRGILQQQHGVAQDAVTWYTMTEERFAGLGTPPGVTLRSIAADGGGPPDGSLQELLLEGALDATMTPRPGDELARRDRRVRQLYSDPVQAQRDYYASTGVFPIMHFVVMREELDAQHPWLAESLCAAFVTAKAQAMAAGAGLEPPIAGFSADEARAVFGDDTWPYGLGRNRRALETFVEFATTQGLLQQPVAIDDLFAPSTRHLFE
jgi:4,5-dihydroxyphthalate decarboxylase